MGIKRHVKNPRHTSVIDGEAHCANCDWSVPEFTVNAIGLAAQHFEKTGHNVTAQQTIQVDYDRSYAR